MTSCGYVLSNEANHVKDTELALPSSRSGALNGLDHASSIKSVLLMPRVGMQFKVTFTEAEMLLTLNLSEHHRKCYRLMKYIINGEPFPLEPHKNRIAKCFETDHTVFHSYILKRAVWEHHYIEECNEEIHLGNCVRKMSSLVVSTKRNDLIHPFNKHQLVDTSKCNERFGKTKMLQHEPDVLKLADVAIGVQKIMNTPIDKYDYQDCLFHLKGCNFSKSASLMWRLFLIILCLGLLSVIAKLGLNLQTMNDDVEFKTVLVKTMACVLFAAFIFYIFFARNVVNLKWALLANHLSLCTKHIELWLLCAFAAVLLVMILLVPEALYLYIGIAAGATSTGLLYFIMYRSFSTYINVFTSMRGSRGGTEGPDASPQFPRFGF